MHTLGLLGGMTYHATALYYKQINDRVQARLGGRHSAKIVLQSFDFDEIMSTWLSGDREGVGKKLSAAAANLKTIGADAIVLCVNTNHMFAEAIEKAAGIPLLHIIDFSAEAIKAAGLGKIALLGTRATMEGDFIRGRLEKKHGLEVLLPDTGLMDKMDSVIFNELPKYIITDDTKEMYTKSARSLVEQGAQGIILGCTELGFVLKQEEFDVPLFDTVALHARGVADWAVEGHTEK